MHIAPDKAEKCGYPHLSVAVYAVWSVMYSTVSVILNNITIKKWIRNIKQWIIHMWNLIGGLFGLEVMGKLTFMQDVINNKDLTSFISGRCLQSGS